MKIVLVFILFALAAADLNQQAKVLAEMSVSSMDAVEDTLAILKSFKNESVVELEELEAFNKTQVASQTKILDALNAVADQNKAAGDAQDAEVNRLSTLIDSTMQHLAYIGERRTEIIRKRTTIQEQRCAAAMIFVKSIKQHREALEVIVLLKSDVEEIVENQSSFVQVQGSIEKLQAYSHLFNREAIEQFMQLAQEAKSVDEELQQWDTDATDNSRGAIELENGYVGVAKRDVGNRFIDMINKLHDHIVASLENLKDNEIQSAWDVVEWLSESEKELIFLEEDEEKQKYIQEKAMIEIVEAKARSERLWAVYFDSSKAVHAAIEDNYAKEQIYLQKKKNMALIDEVIAIFMESVHTMDNSMKGLVTDVHTDGDFDSEIGRSADGLIGRRA